MGTRTTSGHGGEPWVTIAGGNPITYAMMLQFGHGGEPWVTCCLNPTEKSRLARPTQVETYTPDELGKLWEYAPPFQRLVMLLALNCGFGKAELASLEMDEVLLRTRHPHEREVGYTGSEADSWILRRLFGVPSGVL